MVWAYWNQARPYALWLFLTTAQSLLFLMLHKDTAAGLKSRRALTVIHLFLSLTVVFSAGQILAVSFLLWRFKKVRMNDLIFMTFLPLLICLYYYAIAPKFLFYFKDSPLEVIGASIPKDRLFLLGVYGLLVGLAAVVSRMKKPGPFKFSTEGKIYAYFLGIIFAFTALVMLAFKLQGSPQAQFQVSNRYFIYLTPLGIIGITIFSHELYRMVQGKKFFVVLTVCVLVFFLAFRFYKTYQLINGHYF